MNGTTTTHIHTATTKKASCMNVVSFVVNAFLIFSELFFTQFYFLIFFFFAILKIKRKKKRKTPGEYFSLMLATNHISFVASIFYLKKLYRSKFILCYTKTHPSSTSIFASLISKIKKK